MCTSDNTPKRRATATLPVYVGATLFCLIFFLIYDRFSHNVRSPYMTYLFCFPLILGVAPALLYIVFPSLIRPGRLAYNIYNSGAATVTVSSVLRGIFEIAGNSSVYQTYLMYAGAAMLQIALIIYALTNNTRRPLSDGHL